MTYLILQIKMILYILFQIITFKGPNLAENLPSLAETPKIVGPRRVHEAPFFQLQRLFVLGQLVTWSSAKGSDGQNYRGKIEGRSLLNTACHRHLIILKTPCVIIFLETNKSISKSIVPLWSALRPDGRSDNML